MKADPMAADHTIRCEHCGVSCSTDGQLSTFLREAFLAGHDKPGCDIVETGKSEP